MTQHVGVAHGQIVAGAVAEGHGVLVGWNGRRERTLEQLLDVATVAGVPREWLPRVKQPAVQLARACRGVAGNTYDVEVVPATDDVTWDARYLLVRRPTGAESRAGDAYGHVVLAVELRVPDDGAPTLAFEASPDAVDGDTLVTAIRTAFWERVGADVYTAADVTKWLSDVLHRRLGAIRYGGNWYVPAGTKSVAGELCDALRTQGWGSAWMHPPLPVATSAELSLGLALGLQGEVADVMADLDYARRTAREAGKPDVSAKVAEGFVAKFHAVAERMRANRHLLGEERLDESLMVVADALASLDVALGA